MLCGLLESSGVAGHPASYFRREVLDEYADAWGIARPDDGEIDGAFLQAALTAGRTANGVTGMRVMRETLPELTDALTRLSTGLAADPSLTVIAVLDYLGLEPPETADLLPRHHRQADEVNRDWIARFRSE